MKAKIRLLFIFSLFIFVACDKNDENNDSSSLLIGYWINPQMSDTVITYEKSTKLKDNDYGFAMKPGGLFIERTNAGWCGTPPITFGDFEGTWSGNDSIINIIVGYWGGKVNYQWKIMFIDNNELIVYKSISSLLP